MALLESISGFVGNSIEMGGVTPSCRSAADMAAVVMKKKSCSATAYSRFVRSGVGRQKPKRTVEKVPLRKRLGTSWVVVVGAAGGFGRIASNSDPRWQCGAKMSDRVLKMKNQRGNVSVGLEKGAKGLRARHGREAIYVDAVERAATRTCCMESSEPTRYGNNWEEKGDRGGKGKTLKGRGE